MSLQEFADTVLRKLNDSQIQHQSSEDVFVECAIGVDKIKAVLALLGDKIEQHGYIGTNYPMIEITDKGRNYVNSQVPITALQKTKKRETRTDDERYNTALEYIDKLFPNLPDFKEFQTYLVIGDKTNSLSTDERKDAYQLQDEMVHLLVRVYGYAEFHPNYNSCLELSVLGRNVKKIGGHFKYQEYLLKKSDESNAVEKQKNQNVELQNKVLKFQEQNRILDRDLKEAQFRLVDAQRREIKLKRLWAVLGAVGGALLGYFVKQITMMIEAMKH